MEKRAGKSDSKLYAFLATFLSIIGFVIAIVAKKNDKYVMYYAKQGLVIFILSLILSAISWSFVYSGFFWTIRSLLNLVILVLWILSWVYALSGKEKEVPVIGSIAKKFNF